MKIQLSDIQTLEHLREYIEERLTGSTVLLDGDEVIIRTGMGIDLGNYLYPLHEGCDVCEAKPGEPHCSCGNCDCSV